MPQLIVSLEKQIIKRVNLQRDTYTIGRSSTSDLMLADRVVSNEHARIMHKASEYILEDLGSTNSTYVNRRVIKEHWLEDGDIIQIGRHFLSYSMESTLQEQLNRLKSSPDLTDKTWKAWLEIMNGRHAGYRIPLKLAAQPIVLVGDQGHQLRLQTLPNAYVLHRVMPNGEESTQLLNQGDAFTLDTVTFKLHPND